MDECVIEGGKDAKRKGEAVNIKRPGETNDEMRLTVQLPIEEENQRYKSAQHSCPFADDTQY